MSAAVVVPGCPPAPSPAAVRKGEERARRLTAELSRLVAGWSAPPAPQPPFTQERGETWELGVAGPWWKRRAASLLEFENRYASLGVETYERARLDIALGDAWRRLAELRNTLPDELGANESLRQHYTLPRSNLYREVAEAPNALALVDKKTERARWIASKWGLFSLGVHSEWFAGGDLLRKNGLLRMPFSPPKPPRPEDETLPFPLWRDVNDGSWAVEPLESLDIGQYGLTPRQLACARRWESHPRVRHDLGRYFTSRALVFGDELAAREALRLLGRDETPAAIVDWFAAKTVTSPYDLPEEMIAGLLAALPRGSLGRTYLAWNWLSSRTPHSPLVTDVFREEPSPPGFRCTSARPFSWWTPQLPPIVEGVCDEEPAKQ